MGSFVSRVWDDYAGGVLDFLLNLVIAAVIAFIGRKVIAKLTRILRNLIERTGKIDRTLAAFVESMVGFVLNFILVIIVLDQIGIDNSSFIALLGAAVFALAFALQGSLENFAAGVMLLTFQPFKVGDEVAIADEEGVVRRIELFTTVLETEDGRIVIAPNGDVANSNIVNFNSVGRRRVDMTFNVPIVARIDTAKYHVWEVLDLEPRVMRDPIAEVGVLSVNQCLEDGDDHVVLFVQPWCHPDDYEEVRADLLEIIHTRLQQVDLAIAPPTQDFGPRSLDHIAIQKAKRGGGSSGLQVIAEDTDSDSDSAMHGDDAKDDDDDAVLDAGPRTTVTSMQSSEQLLKRGAGAGLHSAAAGAAASSSTSRATFSKSPSANLASIKLE
eukprot:TRINITY_DN76413_c0_g1_i1.p1 TRINITY_DN76413_c0_g1~~TRINITY_DN76413_c0_g1_i1.p1  ORF type:complete len:384 (-),score=196.51 TRINITY_DN76413_c0_g1_i1:69-1220(-)